MAAIPCSRVRSAAIGLVELQGKAIPRKAQNAPLSDLPCCWWRCVVEELVKSGKSSHWRTIATRSCSQLFYLEDPTGAVLIDPEEAEIHADKKVFDSSSSNLSSALSSWGIDASSWLGLSKRLRVWESVIPLASPLYVLGELALRVDHLAERNARLKEKLAGVKKNAERMALADTNKDGQVDVAEWDALRLQLEQEFLQEEAARPAEPPQDKMLVRRPASYPFIVSTRPEASLLRALGISSWAGVLSGLAATGGAVAWAQQIGYGLKGTALFCLAGAALGLLVNFQNTGGTLWCLLSGSSR